MRMGRFLRLILAGPLLLHPLNRIDIGDDQQQPLIRLSYLCIVCINMKDSVNSAFYYNECDAVG